jgi:hypothetical protein
MLGDSFVPPRRRGAPANNSLSNEREALDDGAIGGKQLGFGYGLANSLPRDGAGEKQPATSAFVSMTAPWLSSARISASRGRTLADAITKALKLVCVGRAQPVVFLL